MSNFAGNLQGTKFQKIGDDSVPGMQILFEQAGDLCKANPKFQSSLIVALFKAAVAKEKWGKNDKTEERVTNFFRFINTYDPKAAEVVSANLGGPGKRWMRILNAREREHTILASGKCNDKVVAIMDK